VAPNLLENTHFSTEKGTRIISPVKRVELVSDRTEKELEKHKPWFDEGR
jgi:hypothetical protein